MNTKTEGSLYIVATPIGNLQDITYRAINILKDEISLIYCEDTRQTKKLLNHYGINVPTKSLHTHSSEKKIDDLISYINSGNSVAYCTDSGTPGISDPGNKIVKKARQSNINVVPIPGPSALTALLSVSGFVGKTVIFGGFLSKKEGKRKKELEKLREFTGIIIIYESPYRIKKMLLAIKDVFGNAEIIIGREMTKFFEQFINGTIDEIINDLDSLKEKGEFAIAISNLD